MIYSSVRTLLDARTLKVTYPSFIVYRVHGSLLDQHIAG
jgi:hypothetical protein